MTKGMAYALCYWRYDTETCRNYIELQTNIAVAALENGFLFTPYFCSLFADCSSKAFSKISANDFLAERMAVQTSSGYINDLYQTEIIGQEASWSNYTILQLNDLKVDPDYVKLASSDCRELACCHARADGSLPQNLDAEYRAGPYGH